MELEITFMASNVNGPYPAVVVPIKKINFLKQITFVKKKKEKLTWRRLWRKSWLCPKGLVWWSWECSWLGGKVKKKCWLSRTAPTLLNSENVKCMLSIVASWTVVATLYGTVALNEFAISQPILLQLFCIHKLSLKPKLMQSRHSNYINFFGWEIM